MTIQITSKHLKFWYKSFLDLCNQWRVHWIWISLGVHPSTQAFRQLQHNSTVILVVHNNSWKSSAIVVCHHKQSMASKTRKIFSNEYGTPASIVATFYASASPSVAHKLLITFPSWNFCSIKNSDANYKTFQGEKLCRLLVIIAFLWNKMKVGAITYSIFACFLHACTYV